MALVSDDSGPKPPRFGRAVLPITSGVAAALLLGSCGPSADVASTDVAICRDAAGRRIDDARCGRGGAGGAHIGSWYYLARGSTVPAVGDDASGGSASPRAGVGYARASSATVTRGGFGGSGEGAGE